MDDYARFIPGEEIIEVQQWQFGALDTAAQLLAKKDQDRQAQTLVAKNELERQQAYKEGYAEGVKQGKVQASADVQKQMQDFLSTQGKESADKLGQLFAAAQHQLQDAEQAMAQGVLDLSCELARQVLRHELTINPLVVMPVLIEAIGLLGEDHKVVVVKLNSHDLNVLGKKIHADFAGMNLNLRADPQVLPGGCLVESAGTVVDASVQKRWQRAVATLGLTSYWEAAGEPS